MDEPFSALDTQIREQMELELRVLGYYQGEVLFVTHNLDELIRVCSKMAVYDSGRILQIGNRQQVIESPIDSVVALTGVRNLLDGIVADIEGTNTWVRLPGQERPVKVVGEPPKEVSRKTSVLRSESAGIDVNGHSGENTLLCQVDKRG